MLRRAAALALLAALVAAPLAVAAIDEPDWSLRDRWSYFVRKAQGYDNATAFVSSVGADTLTLQVTTWSNTTQPSPVPGVPPTSVSTATTVNTTFRERDLAVLRVVTTTSSGGGPLQTQVPITTNTTYPDGCRTVDWPLEVGKEWRVQCSGTTTTTASPTPTPTTLDLRFRVQDRTEVTVPAGTFTAYVIANITSAKPTDLQYFVPSVCNHVKTSKLDASGRETTVLELVSYACDDEGVDDWTPPPDEEEPPAEEDENDTPPAPPPDEEQDDTPPPPAPEEDDGIPAPGVLVALAVVAAAALAASRRR